MSEKNPIEIKEKIEKLEKKIAEKKKKLAKLKQSLAPQSVDNYEFKTWDGGTTNLADLFGDDDELIMVHNMGKRCPYCTLWADGFNGIREHLADRAAFVVASPDEPDVQKQFAESRDWQFKMVSYGENSFVKEMGFLQKENEYWPGVSTFVKDKDGNIHRSAWSCFGPGDDFCSLWHIFDLLPKGPDGWEPKYSYK